MYRPTSLSLTGATGQIGQALLRRLAQDHPGVELRLLVRSESTAFRHARFQSLLQRFGNVRLIFGDMADLRLQAADARLLCGSTGGLWHLAASTNLGNDTPETSRQVFDVNLSGTRSLLRLCEEHGCERLFHISTAFVAGCREDLVHEADLCDGQGFRNSYEASKAEAERLVRAAAACGLPVTIFRPSLVVDDGGAPLPRSLPAVFASAFRDALRNGRETIALPLPPSASINIVSERFVTSVFLHLAALPASGTTYHVTASQPTSLQTIADALAAVAPRVRIQHVPEVRSSLLARMLAALRSYWETRVRFDRGNLVRDCGPDAEATIDWTRLIERELATVEH